ncbi:MAG: histidine--tRNA ligase [Rhodospirillales bacterium]
MKSLKPVRGTHDVLPEEMLRHRHVESKMCEIASLYGYGEISTPIFEFTEVFARTLGDTSDVVTKEMYTFDDKGGDSITLRPENTAGVARAFISNGMTHSLPLKLFYRGPMFRYERPQKGRQRQFNQVGAELIGAPRYLADVEVVALADHFLDALGIKSKVTLEINTLGDSESRMAYRGELVEYLNGFKGKLSSDSLERLEKNPLRILDSKDQGDKSVVAGAPLMADSLSDGSRKYFDDLLTGLESIGVTYRVNPKLVRGLDYYCHSIFEFTTDRLGAQGAVVAGGRYDGLIEQMGGPPTPGTGWAAGVERLAMLVDTPLNPPRPIVIVPVSDAQEKVALTITQKLRRAGFTVELGFSGNMGKRMKRANRMGASAVVLLGEDEISRDAATVRNMESGEQVEVPLAVLEDHLSLYH